MKIEQEKVLNIIRNALHGDVRPTEEMVNDLEGLREEILDIIHVLLINADDNMGKE